MKKTFLFIKIKSLIIISPEKSLLKKAKDALLLIKNVDSKEYIKIFSRLNIVFITNKNGFSNEFFMPEKIWFVNKSVIKNNDLKWLASLIIHEAFHATQFKNGKYVLPFGEKLERPAIDLQEKFLKRIKDLSSKKQLESEFKRKYWKEIEDDELSYSYFRNLLRLFETKKLKLMKIKTGL